MNQNGKWEVYGCNKKGDAAVHNKTVKWKEHQLFPRSEGNPRDLVQPIFHNRGDEKGFQTEQ